MMVFMVHAINWYYLPEYDWELKEMFKDFRSFQHEEADKNEVIYQHLDSFKTMIVKKTWEG